MAARKPVSKPADKPAATADPETRKKDPDTAAPNTATPEEDGREATVLCHVRRGSETIKPVDPLTVTEVEFNDLKLQSAVAGSFGDLAKPESACPRPGGPDLT